MTTSFAHFVRGEWLRAARANFSGLLLALGCAVYLPWSAVSIRRRRTWLIGQPDLWGFALFSGWLIIVVLEWGGRHILPRLF